MAYIVLLLLGLALIAWFAAGPSLAALRRARIARRPFPPAWRAVLRRWPLYRRLPADLQLQLKRQIQVFLADKRIVGCAGLEVTDEMRVLVAAQACLLLLNRRGARFRPQFARLTEVLLYPGAFIVERDHGDGSGVLQRRRDVLTGESWVQGQVVLSWDDALAGALDADDGRNVAIHEFAHQLDQDKGHANGAPAAGRWRRGRMQRWARVFDEAFTRLRAQLAQPAAAIDRAGAPPLIDPYGATDPAEFFAVVSEVFFERPRALAAQEPALYRELAGFYRVDPLSW